MGFGVLAIGTGIALLPETAFAFAMAKIPAGAVTTTLFLVVALLSPAIARAQGKTVQPTERSELRRQLEDNIMCTCGGCGAPMGSCPMRPNCSHYDEQAKELASYLAEGKGRDEVIALFVKQYGGEHVLAAPIDKGSHRLAWLVPYAMGATGLVGAVILAVRWSRQSGDQKPAIAKAEDAALGTRLDDELRDLD